MLNEKVRGADAVIIATHENNSIPGVLKNASTWRSWLPAESTLPFKPVTIVGGSVWLFGTARAQAHLRQVLNALEC